MHTYDLNKLLELLADFHNLTGVKISIHDSAGKELCYYPARLTPFCAQLRRDADADARCRACDSRAYAECRRTHRRVMHICHAGLAECFAPVLYGEELVGYVAIGQIRTDESALPEEYASRGEGLREAYMALPVIAADKISSAIHILDACAGYEFLRSLVGQMVRERMDSRIARYVEEHLREELSVEVLCRQFHLPRGELYALFRESFGATVARFVRSRRLHRACELLTRTSLPVAEVAVHCGIPDYNYFSKQFRRAFGMTPTAWRLTGGA